ncbi:MAG: serine/threonine protein kinase [Gemmataceae bacterium]|nr:serine/threonine protein kinase [Gemmataceae bacterium]
MSNPESPRTDGPASEETRALGVSPANWSAVALLEPSQAPDELGRLAGFRVLEKLGQGGMGVVFKAEDIQLVRPVALKVLRPEFVTDPKAGHAFLREARALAALRDEHVVTIYQAGESNSVVFLAMELLVGCTLEQYLDRNKPLSLKQKLRIGRETALGLAAARKAGMIHRDIKPGNLWLESPSGRIKVLDFGLARPQSADDAGPTFGTPAYMAPEQTAGHLLDARCDLYSLGVVMFRLTTGRLPFADLNAQALLTRAAAEPAPDVREYSPDTPTELADIVARLLSKDPVSRPLSARHVADELHSLERSLSRGRTAHSMGAAKTPPPRSNRRQWLAAGLVGATALVAVASRYWRRH